VLLVAGWAPLLVAALSHMDQDHCNPGVSYPHINPLETPYVSRGCVSVTFTHRRRIELKLRVGCSIRSPPPATERVMADFSCASTIRTSHVLFRVSVVAAALVLTGCNANQAINPSGQAGRCANDPSCDPYNPISYAQNNTGNAGGGGK
jgi:hypothetical protein